MKLSRIGANRKEVRSVAFEDREPELSIDSSKGEISLTVHRADGMGTQGQYNYTITLSASDVAAILKALAAERHVFKPGKLHAAVEASAVPLVRLLSAAASLPFQIAPTEAELREAAVREKLAAKQLGKGNA